MGFTGLGREIRWENLWKEGKIGVFRGHAARKAQPGSGMASRGFFGGGFGGKAKPEGQEFPSPAREGHKKPGKKPLPSFQVHQTLPHSLGSRSWKTQPPPRVILMLCFPHLGSGVDSLQKKPPKNSKKSTFQVDFQLLRLFAQVCCREEPTLLKNCTVLTLRSGTSSQVLVCFGVFGLFVVVFFAMGGIQLKTTKVPSQAWFGNRPIKQTPPPPKNKNIEIKIRIDGHLST